MILLCSYVLGWNFASHWWRQDLRFVHLSRPLCNKVHPADAPPHCFVYVFWLICPYWFLEFPRFVFVQTVVASDIEIVSLPYKQMVYHHNSDSGSLGFKCQGYGFSGFLVAPIGVFLFWEVG